MFSCGLLCLLSMCVLWMCVVGAWTHNYAFSTHTMAFSIPDAKFFRTNHEPTSKSVSKEKQLEFYRILGRHQAEMNIQRDKHNQKILRNACRIWFGRSSESSFENKNSFVPWSNRTLYDWRVYFMNLNVITRRKNSEFFCLFRQKLIV